MWKIFENMFGGRDKKHEAMGRSIEEALDKARAELFLVKLEKERILADEFKLVNRIERLESEEKAHAELRAMEWLRNPKNLWTPPVESRPTMLKPLAGKMAQDAAAKSASAAAFSTAEAATSAKNAATSYSGDVKVGHPITFVKPEQHIGTI